TLGVTDGRLKPRASYLLRSVTVSEPCRRLPGIAPANAVAVPPAYCANTLKLCIPCVSVGLATAVVNDQLVTPTKPVLFDTMYWRPARNVALSSSSTMLTTALWPDTLLLI